MTTSFMIISFFLLIVSPPLQSQLLSETMSDYEEQTLNDSQRLYNKAMLYQNNSESDTGVGHWIESALGNEYLPAIIIFRMKDEMSAYCKRNDIDHNEFARTLTTVKASSIRKIFPNHLPPSEKIHPSGEEYVDLSLIYQMEVDSNQSVEAAIQSLYDTGMVVYAEPRPLPSLMYVIEGQPTSNIMATYGITTPDNDPNPLDATIKGRLEEPPAKRFVPNDSLLFAQYYLENIRAYDAWAVAQGDTNTVIAIVDTGNDFFHPDLQHAVKYNYNDPINGKDLDEDGYVDNFSGWDLGEGNNNPQYNKVGHGVHVSGTAAATVNNRLGIAGTGFHSRYLPIKVDDEFGRLVKAYEGIVYAADQGASVINCSWGGHLSGGAFGSDVVRYATINHDALIVAGAGNAGNNLPFYPASYDYVLGIAATDSLDLKWERSSYGRHIGLSAPGVRILSTWPDTMYILSSGTSMAAPVVAGAAAIIRSHYPELTALQTAARMQATADLIDTIPGNISFAGQMGAGRLNMYRALTDEFTPYIRVSRNLLADEHLATLAPRTSFTMALQYQNMLAPANNMLATIRSNSSFVNPTDSIASLGPMQTLETTDNSQQPFRFFIRPGIPTNHDVLFTIQFVDQDGTPAGNHSFALTFNRDYQNVTSGRMQTTITSKGTVGYNYPNYFHGMGLSYDNGYTRIKCAGLVYGNSPTRVVDNIYGAQQNSFNQHFTPEVIAYRLAQPTLANTELRGRFSDQAANAMSFGISTEHHTYFWREADMDNFFIKEYKLINTSDEKHQGLYVGFFADWTSRDNKRMIAAWDKDLAMAFSFLTGKEESGSETAETEDFAGLQIFTEYPANHYAFDNDGNQGSIFISKGFEPYKKYAALTTSRDKAGLYKNDNDVSSMLSAGPFDLLAGDTLRVAFALHMAASLEEIKKSASKALHTYNTLILDNGTTAISYPKPTEQPTLSVYPNPFSTTLHINLGSLPETTCANHQTKVTLSLYDIFGNVTYQRKIDANPRKNIEHIIDTSDLRPGVYLIKLTDGSMHIHSKLIKYE